MVRTLRRININYHYQGTPPPGRQWSATLLARWLILTAAVLVASYLIENIHVDGFVSAFLAAAAIGVLNLFFRPILLILTLPINILTLGLFTFVINALMLKIASGLIPGFSVYGFWSTVLGAIVISVVNWLFNALLADVRRPRHPRGKSKDYIDLEKRGDRWE